MNERTRETLSVVGFAARTSNDAESDPERAQIGGLWGRVFSGGLEAIAHREANGRIAAVYHEYECDHTGPYTIVVGAVVESIDRVPDGMVALTVPAARCAVFEARGEMPGALIAKWMEIWKAFPAEEAVRAYDFDVELHAPDGSAADIWIAVRDT